MNCYLDHFAYSRSPAGLETASLLGNSSRLSGTHLLGVTTLTPVTNTTVALSKYDRITIFDGSNSEVVTVTATTNAGASNIPISSLAYGHADGTPWCSDGPTGPNGLPQSLADQIVNASAWLENITQQSLWQATYTNETLKIPGPRGSIDNQGQLVFSPRHFPITAESGITIKSNNSYPVSYDNTQCIIDQDSQVVSVPLLSTVGGGGSTYSLLPTVARDVTQYLQITYTAGFPVMPPDVVDAAILLTSILLSRRQNPTGAVEIGLGPKHLVQNMRGDNSGETALFKEAVRKLSPYTRTIT